MEPIDIFLLAAGGLGLWLMVRQKKGDAEFANVMASFGASEDQVAQSIQSAPAPALVPSDPASGTPQNAGFVASIQAWANSIFHFEGGNSGNLNVRNNNPGNLKFAGQPGATLGSNGFAVFDSIDQGWTALYRQLQKYVQDFPGLTLTQLYAKYLGQADYMNPQVTLQGNPFTYAETTAKNLGVDPNATIGQIFGGHS